MNRALLLSADLLSRLKFTVDPSGRHLVRGLESDRPRPATPEEIIRQLFALALVHHYGYAADLIRVEYPVQMGSTKKRADLVVTGNKGAVRIVVEAKQVLDDDALAQLLSYATVTRATYAVAVSGDHLRCFAMNGDGAPTMLEDLPIFGSDSNDLGTASRSREYATPPARQPVPPLRIEALRFSGRGQVEVTLAGRRARINTSDLVSFSRFRRALLAHGIVVNAAAKPNDWDCYIESVVEDIAQMSEIRLAEVNYEELQSRVGSVIAGRDHVVLNDLIRSLPLESSRSNQLVLGKVLRSLGWDRFTSRVDGRVQKVWRPDPS